MNVSVIVQTKRCAMTYCRKFFEAAADIHVAQWDLGLAQTPGPCKGRLEKRRERVKMILLVIIDYIIFIYSTEE